MGWRPALPLILHNAGKHSFSVTMRTVGKQTIKVEDVIDFAIKGSATVTV